MKDLEENLLCRKNDDIYSAVHTAINTLAVKEVEFDISLIGGIVDLIQLYLEDSKIDTCYPFKDDNDVICCCSDKRCWYCKHND